MLSLDARPSDSIAIALRTKATIFVNEELLQPPQGPETARADVAAFARHRQLGRSSGSGGPGRAADDDSDGPGGPEDADDEAARLRRFLEKLSPEDFGKFNL